MQESRAITRKSASNLALAFVLLPKAKRDAMSALYAFCREVDDVADEKRVPAPERRAQLAGVARGHPAGLRAEACPSCQSTASCSRSSSSTGCRFEHFDELLQGVEMDLEIKRYPDLRPSWSCTVTAWRRSWACSASRSSAIGIPACRDYAVYLGKALQLTNILRDVRTDAERGRIYLPLSELAALWRDSRGGAALRVFGPVSRAGRQRGRRARAISIVGPAKPCRRRTAESMVAAELMGCGLLAAAAQARAAAIPGLRPGADAARAKPQKLGADLRAHGGGAFRGSAHPAYGAAEPAPPAWKLPPDSESDAAWW